MNGNASVKKILILAANPKGNSRLRLDEEVREIDEHLEGAKVILLLVSADFLASDYCYDVELK